ncbi:OmpH family outer membrane protein [Veillonella sp. CHU110]|uniref:OmpH family outer membrane protein n=1 Tax=Veillonella sp. CHU110 TaxID=2490947 RepID=UPI000F8D76D5|nr:OmpH family outer membrane protein [Veillonella sp. CHU110]
MKDMWKRMATGAMMVCALGLVAGCGSSDKVGVVNTEKIVQESNKAKDLNKEMEAKQKEITDRLAQVQGTQSEEEFHNTQMNAQQELQIFGQAKSKEFKAYVESNIQSVAKEKELTVVANDQAIMTGGIDITEDVIKKMNEGTPSEEASK